MKVSVIVTTKNEEKNIGNCLESVNNAIKFFKNINLIINNRN